jgi:hypothetical protein
MIGTKKNIAGSKVMIPRAMRGTRRIAAIAISNPRAEPVTITLSPSAITILTIFALLAPSAA